MSKQLIFTSNLKRENHYQTNFHHHTEGQLFVIHQGLLVLQTKTGTSIMPSGNAGWIPSNIMHQVKSFGAIHADIFYINPSICSTLPLQPFVFRPNNLLYEIMVRITSWKNPSRFPNKKLRIVQVMIDEVFNSEVEPLYIPIPHEKSLEKIAHFFINNPSTTLNLNEWAKMSHKSVRTFTRHFREQTGITFAKWCQHVRIMHALQLLANGESITKISLSLGYNSVSSFIKVFKMYLGKTPTAYEFVVIK